MAFEDSDALFDVSDIDDQFDAQYIDVLFDVSDIDDQFDVQYIDVLFDV